ncbi:DUF2931 family protein [Psychroserpens sp. NJDZ02]|uniref:DUF2931 family protein n=1 Tax=Psychroserpens sp. NJDZ02 TaxID=2570561 RepID=UPI0010A80B76|nr:DUF2931 family protein [Psychroserpens sp. NJDZ02]QCE40966.1 DUF2931 family protein [Psychroserpens sp. NJDZ02]
MKNKTIIFGLLLTLFFSCNNTKSNTMDNEYEWRVSVNAPKNFPATIYYAALGGVDVRRDGTINSGWGTSGSSSDGVKTLPKTLDIIWLSYIENQFYKGNFELDQEKIKAIFDEGFKDNYGEDIVTYHDFSFVINVAPGGTVALFMKGLGNFQLEVGFFKAEKTDIKWKDFVPMGLQDREKYVKGRLERNMNKDSLAYYKTNGIPFKRWGNYREYFNFKTIMPVDYKVAYLAYNCFNGERFYGENRAYHINETYNSLPIPKKITLNWLEEDNDEYIYGVVLKLKESEYTKMSTFFKNNSNKAAFYIEPYIPVNVREIRLFLKSDTEKIEIEVLPYEVKRKLIKK